MATPAHLWQWRPLSELLTQRKETPSPGDVASGTIRILAKIGFNDGKIQVRPNTNTRTGMILVRPGDLVVSGINAAKGAIAIYEKENAEPLAATIHYGAYIPSPDRVDLRFLWWLLRSQTFREILDTNLPGGIKTELKAKRLLPIKIPLPPLDEQRRIVSRIEELAAKVAEATRLQEEITNQMDALCRTLITNPPDGVLTPTLMNELLVMREPDVKVDATDSYHFAGVYCFGRGVFAGQRKDGSEFAYRSLTRIQKGNFVYPKLMAWEGALGVVPENCDGLYVSPEFPVFEVRQDRVLPEVLDTYFRMPSVWPDLAAISTGTNVRRRRLHPRAFLLYKFPLPSMKVQHQFCLVRRSIEQAKRLKSESTTQLDALMPSILSKAFRGEL
jgi:type I restriction enzyme, S subunit